MTVPAVSHRKIMNEWHPVGIIDIGSNSVRLVVYDNLTRHPTVIFNEKVTCGLGRELASTGHLGKKAMEKALGALRRFKALSRQLEVVELHPFATAAAREAKNGSEFIERAADICGVQIRVVSGTEEAMLAANGVIAGFHKADGIVGDMGGGSLELVDIVQNVPAEGVTTPLGGLRLIDMSGNDVEVAREYVCKILDELDWLAEGKDRTFYAVGGTWRAFARLHMEQIGYPLHILHGYDINKDGAFKFAHLLDHVDLKSMKGFTSFSKGRRETIAYGALLLEELLKRIKPSRILISASGAREGLLYGLMNEKTRAENPLLASCKELAYASARCHSHARELADWMDTLFDGGSDSEKMQESRKDKCLRRAACYLSDIGWRYHVDFRAQQVVNVIAYADFAGASHKDRAFLAAVTYYRYKGIKAALPDLIVHFLGEKQIHRAKLIGAAIRLVYIVAVVMPGVVEKMPIEIVRKKLVLHLPQEYAVLKGEKLNKRLAQLADLVGLEGEVRIIKNT